MCVCVCVCGGGGGGGGVVHIGGLSIEGGVSTAFHQNGMDSVRILLSIRMLIFLLTLFDT